MPVQPPSLFFLATFLFPALILYHLLLAPYSKVEESFNLQATHDIIAYGIPISGNIRTKFELLYDHMVYPGAVPRTFVGAGVLAGITRPLSRIFGFVRWGGVEWESGWAKQVIVRGALGLFNATALIFYAYGVRKAFGTRTAAWYVMLQASQFHVVYYASRTLPNMFAFGLTTIALRFSLPDMTTLNRIKRTRLTFYLLTITTVLFRSDLALLIISHAVYILYKSPTLATRISIVRTILIPAGLSGAIAGLLLTVPIDTFFWQSPTPIWPELSAFFSNVFPSMDGQGASAWGTSPWHWYFTSAIPRLFINPIVPAALLPFSMYNQSNRNISLDLMIPSITYVILYSFLAHKETRFLFPIIPSLTTAAAVTASNIHLASNRFRSSRIILAILLITTIPTFILAHFVFLHLSSLNYPGAVALQSLHQIVTHHPVDQCRTHVSVYLGDLACQTGVTRFLQCPSLLDREIQPGAEGPSSCRSMRGKELYWTYDKSPLPVISASSTNTAASIPSSSNTTTTNTNHISSQQSPIDFWDRFDYAILESPSFLPNDSTWEIIELISALSSSPRLLRPHQDRTLKIFGPKAITRASHHAPGDPQSSYGYGPGESILYFWDIARDVLREGHLVIYIPWDSEYGVGGMHWRWWRWVSLPPWMQPGFSWTGGWWVEPRMVERLWILRNNKPAGES